MSSVVETVERVAPTRRQETNAAKPRSVAGALLDALVCLVLLVGPIVALLAFA